MPIKNMGSRLNRTYTTDTKQNVLGSSRPVAGGNMISGVFGRVR